MGRLKTKKADHSLQKDQESGSDTKTKTTARNRLRMAIMDTNWQALLSSNSDVPPDVFFLVTTDEHLETEGESIGAHRFLLSCVSPVFRGMLLGPMKERGR